MTQSFEYDGNPLTRVRHSTVTLVQQAEQLGVGQGRLTLNDPTGTQAIVGQMDFDADQDACSNPVMFRGFVGDQDYRRGAERAGPGREIEFSVEDLNAIAGFRTFEGNDADSGDRPEETVDERIAWLESTGMLPGVLFGTRVASSSRIMEATNYRDQTPSDVLAACALAADFSGLYIREFDPYDGPELVFRDDNTSTADTSPLSISNVPGEADQVTVFPPLQDFVLSKRPGRVASRVHFSYRGGRVTERREATADAFNGRRDITASNSNVKRKAVARKRAQALLWEHHTEERLIEGSVLLPPEAVNLAAHGDRIGVRLEHMTPEGFYDADELVYCRILETRIRPMLRPTRLYEVGMRLAPQEERPPAAVIVQSDFFGAGDGGGGNGTLPDLVTIGHLLIFCSSDRSGENPAAPNTSASLPRWGAGAWTLINAGTVRNGGAGSDGIAFWGKVADSTERIGRVTNSNSQNGIWEIACPDAAATLAAISVIDEVSQVNPLSGPQVLSTGSLGTLAEGELALYCTNWGDQTNEGEASPSAAMAAGWTRRHFEPAYKSGTIIREHTPYTVIADAVGDGSAITAAVTRSHLNRSGGVWGNWCGMAIKVVPQ